MRGASPGLTPIVTARVLGMKLCEQAQSRTARRAGQLGHMRPGRTGIKKGHWDKKRGASAPVFTRRCPVQIRSDVSLSHGSSDRRAGCYRSWPVLAGRAFPSRSLHREAQDQNPSSATCPACQGQGCGFRSPLTLPEAPHRVRQRLPLHLRAQPGLFALQAQPMQCRREPASTHPPLRPNQSSSPLPRHATKARTRS